MSSKPIRVLHIFGALNPGGVETFVMNVYRCIDREKIQFDFALTQGKKSFFDDEVLAMGGRIFYFDQSKSILKNLALIYAENPPYQAIHSHVYFYSGMILRGAKRAGIPIRIAHAHNTEFGQIYTLKRKAYEYFMRKLILRNATKLLGCSTDACEFVFGKSCMKDFRCQVIHNGFDVDAFRYDEIKRNQLRFQYKVEDKVVIGHVGRFEEQKNHTFLIDIFSALLKKCPDAVLLMVGRGSKMDEIREKCRALGIFEKCLFVGAQRDVQDYYNAMDVFLFPSLYEGLGSVLVEAQANGLPVVTSKTVVPTSVNVTGNVTFVPLTESPELWADAVLRAAEEREKQEENDNLKTLYDIQTVTNRLYKIYAGR